MNKEEEDLGYIYKTMLNISKVIQRIEELHGIEKNGGIFHHSTNQYGLFKK